MDQSSSVLSVLQKVPLFTNLSPSQLKRVLSICQQERFEAGTVLCRVGGESDRMFVVLSGSVEIQSANGGVLARETAITTIGETGILTGESRSATVVATTPVSAMVIRRRAFMRLVQDDPSVALRLYRNVMLILRQKLVGANQRLEALQPAEQSGDEGETASS